MQTRRKTCAVGSASLLAAAVALALQACGGDAGSGSAGFGGGCGASGTAIAGNHAAPNAHTLAVPAADLRAGSPATYTTGGTTDHVHRVTLSGAQLLALANGSAVPAVSTAASSATFTTHTHTIDITCP